jgi:transposase
MDTQEAKMPAIKYRVTLSEKEVTELEALLRKGKSAARKQTRARILLKAAAGCKDTEIIEALAVSATMIGKARQRCVEEGVDAALNDRARPGAAPKLTEKQCAHVIAVACTPAPDGHDHWTLRLLADQVVQLGYADSFSYEAVRQLLKKHPETVAATGMVYSRGGRRFRGADGRRAGSVRSALRSGVSDGLLR